MKKAITVYIDFDLYEKLQDLKINQHKNISSFIASVIKEKLENNFYHLKLKNLNTSDLNWILNFGT